jgi:hypothetical protein
MWIAPKSERARRDLAQGLPESAQSLPAGASQERWAMKFFPGLAVSAALVCAAPAVDAQMLGPYDAGKGRLVSDVDGPYLDAPEAPPPAPRYYGYGPDRGYAPDYRYAPDRGYGRDYGYAPAPALLPPQEVYAILRDNGFSPLGIPRQRGYVYVIAALDRGGEDGRLMIDGRNGRIIRFVPASRWGEAYDRMSFGRGRDLAPSSGAVVGALPTPINATPRPPASLPSVASRGAVPAQAQRPAVVATKPPAQPLQQSAAKPAEAPKQAGTVGEAKPAAPPIKPSQDMPAVQGLE